jgi:hypothetical protein
MYKKNVYIFLFPWPLRLKKRSNDSKSQNLPANKLNSAQVSFGSNMATLSVISTSFLYKLH